MARLKLTVRTLIPLVAAATLAACASGTTGSGATSSGDFAAIAAGTATAAQVSSYTRETGTKVTSMEVDFEQKFEFDADQVGSDEILQATLEAKVSGQGTVAVDGSAASMDVTMEVPGFGALDVQVEQFDGKTWVLNPMTQEWEESSDTGTSSPPSPADAADFVSDDLDLTFVGPETVSGQEAYRYDATVVVTEEILSQAQTLAGNVIGSEIVGSEVEVSIWLGEKGLVKFEYRVAVGEQISAAAVSDVELASDAVVSVLTLEVTGYDVNPLPSGPPTA